MKSACVHTLKARLLLAALLALNITSFGQGRVVVNEFMPWSGCNTTNEFIELMNFGPGPMDIGCYIVTNGIYAVTIPPNTVLEPGEYYVISGSDVLALDCGNVDSSIHVNLNWTTCNCTSDPVPTTGDGFMENGGSSNEKIVLLDPDLNVVDAVSRSSNPSASVAVTTSALAGACTSKTFDLDTMNIRYESIGSSTGIDNSFARKVDGDCGWVKTTAISANAPNKTGNTASASYSFTTVSASECAGTAGFVSIGVNAPDVVSLFPMTYTLAFDADSNNIFDETDKYVHGTDASPSSIDISNLAYGRYRITVGSSAGCNLQSFNFFIFNCYGVILPLQLIEFKHEGVRSGQHRFKCTIKGLEHCNRIVLEGSEGGAYNAVTTIDDPASLNANGFTVQAPLSAYTQFRLRIVSKNEIESYSQVISIRSPQSASNRIWPNPVRQTLFVRLAAHSYGKVDYCIFNATGRLVKKGSRAIRPGMETMSIDTDGLPSGVYMIRATGAALEQPVVLRMVKE